MRPRIVDTSLLFAFFDRRDVHHDRARTKMADPGPVMVPNEVLVELMGLMTHRAGRKGAQEALASLRRHPFVELGHETYLDEALAFLDSHSRLSLVDAVAISHAWRLGCDLDTFDERQEAAWRRR